ncbi:MAG TPA: SPOR domain-containing protein, partial [Saprospiraceae bacterium]|nr:SPOR domain-containing protein [Saprospiraceae bacterium]
GANMLWVIGGTFADKANAERRRSALSSKGFHEATIEAADNGTNQYVVVAKVSDAHKAVEIANELMSKGFKTFIKKK